MRTKRILGALLILLFVSAPLVASDIEEEGEIIELIPDKRSGWGPTNLFAPITGFFLGGPGYWYSERRIRIETTPSGAALDLFYIRANFQKGYEQADSPITLVLPSRVEAGKRDSITIRAIADGYKQQVVHVMVRSRQTEVSIDLAPLPNSLVALTHTYFAGRGSLTFLTKELLQFRVSKDRSGKTYSVVLTETGVSPEAKQSFDGIATSLIKSVKGSQLGEDLVVRIAFTDKAASGVDMRQSQSFDPVRGLHSFSLNLSPKDDGAEAVRKARSALARINSSAVRGCSLEFDAALHDRLDIAALSRALAPKGAFTDKYVRSALRRFGELSPGGVVRLADGTTYRVSVPIELEAAQSQAAEVQGFLGMLREFVAELEAPAFRRETLRGLIAPEVTSSRFKIAVDEAEAREHRCRAGSG